jgi:predicted DNA binding CopG/RHH family protein
MSTKDPRLYQTYIKSVLHEELVKRGLRQAN